MDAQRIVRFGSFELDLDSGELHSNGRRVALQGQPAQVLSLLVRHPGQVVSREELRRAIWADDTFVDFEAALNVAVNKVRQSLHDSASAPRFIETVPKRGYRFLADVHAVDVGVPDTADAGVPVTPPGQSRRFPSFLAARGPLLTALMFAIALPLLWSAQRRDVPAARPKSLAVLPFRPLVAESRDEALEVGLAEAVIIRLGQLKQVRVPSINAVQRYAKLDPDPQTAGRELGVDAVLEGSVLRLNGNVRLSVRLIDVAKGTTLWAHQWDIPWTDIFTVQDVMAREVSRALAVSLAAEADSTRQNRPTSVAAYEGYLRARYLLRQRTLAGSRRAAELLEEVIKVDPKSAEAYASLAFAYISVPLLEGPSAPFVDLGRQAARRALDLDPTIAEAHASLGRIMIHFDWDAEGGEREMRRAIELGPDNVFVLHCYSLVLADEGRYEEALALADRALALDPASVLANRDKAVILFSARRYEESIEQSRRTLELDRYSGVAYFTLGRAYEYLNKPEQAVEAYITPFTFSEKNRDLVAALRSAGRGGLKGFWQQRLQSLLQEPEVRTYSVASAYMRIADHDRALAWLEKLFAERGAWVRALKARAEWDPLRTNPRFQDLLRRANMSPMPLLSRKDLDSRRQAIRHPDE